jgi:lipopolysaccharide/colanic/teichoic acid biosynthesis glycosyltransferase
MGAPRSFYSRGGKRLLDVVVAGLALVPSAPLMAAVALLVRAGLGRPVLFRQVRPGRYGRPFTLLKFRTMTEARDACGVLLPDAQRLTPLGRVLRRASLDELTQLWNVLRGDMSLVGPRPLLTEYLPYYTERERLRHLVRPGITGLAQVSGRNRLPWDRRLEVDVQYVERLSLRLDLHILVRTALKVLRRVDVDEANVAEPNLAAERAAALARPHPSTGSSRPRVEQALVTGAQQGPAVPARTPPPVAE